MAGVNLLHMRNNSPAKIAQRTTSELEDSKGVEGVVVIIIVIDRQFLIFIQDVVEVDLKLVATFCGLHHVLNLRAIAPGTRQKFH